MVGRLIIAGIVVCSAFFVTMQRQTSEAVTVQADVAAARAESAKSRADDLERRAAEAETKGGEWEAKARLFEQKLNALKAEQATAYRFNVTSFRFLGKGKDVVGRYSGEGPDRLADLHFSLVIDASPDDVARVRLFDQGKRMAWTTDNGTLVITTKGGLFRRHVEDVLSLEDGETTVDLAVSAFDAKGPYYVVELQRRDGSIVTSGLTR